MKYPAPAVVQLTPKHGLRDCVLSAMSAYLGRPYEEVVAAAGHIFPTFWRVGIENKQAVRIARRLKKRVRWVRDYDIDDDSGVLGVTYNVGRTEHAVLLLDGRILELEDKPINSWEPAAYLAAHNARAGMLLVEVRR
jgi:hypothetical protein